MIVSYRPLSWPYQVPRSEPKSSRFKDHSLPTLMIDLCEELRMFNAEDAVFQSEIPIGKSGRLVSGWSRGDDHGIVIYYTRNGKREVLALDLYDHPLDNIRAAILTIQALRAVERHGGSQIFNQAMSGFAELPAGNKPVRQWWDVLKCSPDATAEEIQSAYRSQARVAHPDTLTGSEDAMRELNEAYELAKAEVIV